MDREHEQTGALDSGASADAADHADAHPAAALHQSMGNAGVAALLTGGGSEIPYREEMEKSFGRSFANVKAHTGGEARRASDAIGARAFAAGDQVAFGESPDRELVAHELAHVVQQERGGGGEVAQAKRVSQPDEAHEREADAVGAAVAAGRPAGPIVESAPAAIHRKKKGTPVDITKDSFAVPFKLTEWKNLAKISGSFGVRFLDPDKPDKSDEAQFEAFKLDRQASVETLSEQSITETTKLEHSLSLASFATPKFKINNLTIEADTSALTAKLENDLKGSAPTLKVEFASVGLTIKGVLGTFDTACGKAELSLKIGASLTLSPESVAQLATAILETKQMAKAAKQGAETYWEVMQIEEALEKKYKNPTPKALKEASALEAKLVRLTERMHKFRNVVAHGLVRLRSVMDSMTKGLAKFAGTFLRKTGGKWIGKVLGRFIPVVGWIDFAADVLKLYEEVVRVLGYESVVWGDPDEADSETDADKDDGSGDGGGGEETDGRGGGDPDGTQSGHGGGETGGAATGAEPSTEPLPDISPKAQRVLDVLPHGTRSQMTATMIAVLNATIPDDLSESEIALLLERLKAKGVPGDPMDAIGRIRREIDALRDTDDAKPSLVIDGEDRSALLDKIAADDAATRGTDEGGGGVDGGLDGDNADSALDETGEGDKIEPGTVEPDGTTGGDRGGPTTDETLDPAVDPAVDPDVDGDDATVPDLRPPDTLVPGDPKKLFTYDAATDAVVFKKGQPEGVIGKYHRLRDGLVIHVGGVALRSQERGDEKSVTATVDIDIDVIQLPDHANTKYPYKINQTVTETVHFVYFVDNDSAHDLHHPDVSDDISDSVDYDGGRWKAKAGASIDLDGTTAAIKRVVPLESETANGETIRHLEVWFRVSSPSSPPIRIKTIDGIKTLADGATFRVLISKVEPTE